ncbi:MAG: FMN-binding protein [Candidatus Muirbacterium halophilum]|nr:FMN-binding protein [Candidatus Muirbacterium halophilum]MCK9476018.1 FMN-binding protein [Candidatus Muirbacterium halophilum]
MKKVNLILILIIGLFLFIQADEKNNRVDFKKQCSKISSDFKIYKVNKIEIGHFVKDKKDFFIFLTSYFSKEKGYQGNTDVIFAIDSELVIDKLLLVKSDDTPDYINFMSAFGFFDSFIGKKPLIKENKLNIEVDSISGATITSNSIIKNVQNTLIEAKKIIQKIKLD